MDDRLRALERAARADPSDLAAGWALVAALDQAGDEVGAWRERCRLAWAGDARAWAEVDRPAVEGVRERGAVASRRFKGLVQLVTAWRDGVVIARDDDLLGLDARELETRWLQPTLGAHPWTSRGPELWTPLGDTCLVVEVRSGDEREACRLPASNEVWGPCGRTADRLLFVEQRAGGGPQRVAVVCTSPRSAAATLLADGRSLAGVAGGARVEVVRADRSVRAYDVDGSTPRWVLEGDEVADVDPSHALIVPRGASDLLRLVALDFGAREWVRPGARGHLARDAAIAWNDEGLIAYGRADGAERWRLPFERRPVAPIMQSARDVLVFAHRVRGGAIVGGLDLASGDRLWDVFVELSSAASVHLDLTDDAVVAAVTNRHEAHLVRITAPEAPSIP